MKAFEIYFSDLNDDAKKRLLDAVKSEMDIYPIAKVFYFEEEHEPDPSRPGPLPSNTHIVSPYKCPKCGFYLIRDNDVYPPKYRYYCQNCDSDI